MSLCVRSSCFGEAKIATLNVTVTLHHLSALNLTYLYCMLEMTPELTILLDLNTVEA